MSATAVRVAMVMSIAVTASLAGCLGGDGATTGGEEPEVTSTGPVQADPTGFQVDQILATPAAGVARTWEWNVEAENFSRFVVTVDVRGFLDAPQYAALHGEITFIDGAGAERLSWGGNGATGFVSGGAMRIVDFDGRGQTIPLGTWSVAVKSDAGPVQFHVVVDLAY